MEPVTLTLIATGLIFVFLLLGVPVFAALGLSGLAGIIALTRTGMRLFWGSEEMVTPRLHLAEAAPVGVLLLLCLALSFWVQPVMAFLDDTAQLLNQPQDYIRAVLEAPSIRQLPLQPGSGVR